MRLKNVQIVDTGGSRGWRGDVAPFRLGCRKLKEFGWTVKYSSGEAGKRAIEELVEEWMCRR